MGWITVLLLVGAALFLLTEPIYITLDNRAGLRIGIHLVFFSLILYPLPTKQDSDEKEKRKDKKPFSDYLLALWRLRNRVRVRIKELRLHILDLLPHEAIAINCSIFTALRAFRLSEPTDTITLFQKDAVPSFDISFQGYLYDAITYLILLRIYDRKHEKERKV